MFALVMYGIDWQGAVPSIYLEVFLTGIVFGFLIGFFVCFWWVRSMFYKACDEFEKDINNEV